MNKKELDNLICDILDIPKTNQMIESQISKFITQHGYTYKEIGRAVYFYVEVLGNKPKKEMGIGIVPYVMDQAKAFFYRKEQEEKEKQKQGRILKELNKQEKDIILANPIRKPRGIHKIKIEDL